MTESKTLDIPDVEPAIEELQRIAIFGFDGKIS